MTPEQLNEARAVAATEVGQLVNRILELAPIAGLHVGIKITALTPTILQEHPNG